MATAADRALNVAELLERILLQLPMKDILLDQRVAKFWRDLVKSSPKLQQALFYRPDYEVETWTAINYGENLNNDNTSVVEAVTPDAEDRPDIPHDTLVMGRVNGLFLECRDSSNYSAANGDCRLRITQRDPRDRRRRERFWGDVYTGADKSRLLPVSLSGKLKPSWHDMYLTQPPTKSVTIWNYSTAQAASQTEYWGDCERETGVTCGDVMEALLEYYSETAISWMYDQLIDVWGICTQFNYDTQEGIDDFTKLSALAGGRDEALSLCTQARDNVYWLLRGDNYKKIEAHGLMKRVVPGEDIEELVWAIDHLPECMGGECNGCRTSTTI